jgi:hypothetical protein
MKQTKRIEINVYPKPRTKEEYKEHMAINEANERIKNAARKTKSKEKLLDSTEKSVEKETVDYKEEAKAKRVKRLTTPPIKPFLLADDFKTDIKDRVTLDSRNKSEYPIIGNTSIYVDFYTNRELSCIGVFKNIQDALLGKMISDDKLVKSFIVERHNAGAEEEALQLNIITTREFMSIIDTLDKYKPYVQYTKYITTTLEDRYQVYPKKIDVKEVADLNHRNDTELISIIKALYEGPVCDEHEVEVSILITTPDSNSDCDNIALNYLCCCQGILFNSVNQIRKLHVRKRISDKETPSIIIEWS